MSLTDAEHVALSQRHTLEAEAASKLYREQAKDAVEDRDEAAERAEAAERQVDALVEVLREIGRGTAEKGGVDHCLAVRARVALRGIGRLAK